RLKKPETKVNLGNCPKTLKSSTELLVKALPVTWTKVTLWLLPGTNRIKQYFLAPLVHIVRTDVMKTAKRPGGVGDVIQFDSARGARIEEHALDLTKGGWPCATIAQRFDVPKNPAEIGKVTFAR